jgi:RNA polymerase sigma factor (sigma-70 family)
MLTSGATTHGARARASQTIAQIMTPQEEQAVMVAYTSGDERAFDLLFDAFAGRLRAFFRRSFPDPSVADDLLQITFQRVHAARASFKPDLAVRPWLFTIAARVRIDELRRRYRLSRFASDEDIDRLPNVESAMPDPDAEQRSRAVRDAIAALPSSQRVVIHLHRFEGLTFAEIARALGMKEGAVRVRAFRAYETLREKLRPLVVGEQS